MPFSTLSSFLISTDRNLIGACDCQGAVSAVGGVGHIIGRLFPKILFLIPHGQEVRAPLSPSAISAAFRGLDYFQAPYQACDIDRAIADRATKDSVWRQARQECYNISPDSCFAAMTVFGIIRSEKGICACNPVSQFLVFHDRGDVS